MRCRVVASRAVVAVALSGAAFTLHAPLASASFEVFDFESVAATAPTYGAAGVFTGVSFTSNNTTVDISRTSGAAFDLMDLGDQFAPFLFPPSWGSTSLSPFIASNIADKFNANFLGDTVVGLSLQYGDFGEDDGQAHLEVWSGADASGVLLSSIDQAWSGNINADPPGQFIYAGSNAVGSIRFWGDGAAFPQSLYWDNLIASVIPSPGSGTVLLCVGGVGFAWRRRR